MFNESISLFNYFQNNLMEGVKLFLSQKKDNGDKLVPISLRIHADVKNFFECVAETSGQSFNGVIQTLLENVKNQTIATEYEQPAEKIKRAFDYQINSLLNAWMQVTHTCNNLNYNDLASLLGWLNNKTVEREDLIHADNLIQLFNKEAQKKFCQTFGYGYLWLQDNSQPIHERSETTKYRWYKNIILFVRGLIKRFYLDETVESFDLSFLCCDREVVNHIKNNTNIERPERITPFVIAHRKINGIEVTSYHLFETNDINYEKCRQYLIALIKIIMYLVNEKIMRYPNGYTITPEEHDKILNGQKHLSDYFQRRVHSYNYHIEDLADIKETRLSEKETDNPHFYNILNSSELFNVFESTEQKDKAPITEKMASKFGMTPKILEKYLWLYENNTLSGHLLETTDGLTSVNLKKLKLIQSEINKCPNFNTSFG